LGLSESLWWVEDVGVIFGLRPKITPTYSLDHRISQRTGIKDNLYRRLAGTFLWILL